MELGSCGGGRPAGEGGHIDALLLVFLVFCIASHVADWNLLVSEQTCTYSAHMHTHPCCWSCCCLVC